MTSQRQHGLLTLCACPHKRVYTTTTTRPVRAPPFAVFVDCTAVFGYTFLPNVRPLAAATNNIFDGSFGPADYGFACTNPLPGDPTCVAFTVLGDTYSTYSGEVQAYDFPGVYPCPGLYVKTALGESCG